jgi:hypothetical protein
VDREEISGSTFNGCAHQSDQAAAILARPYPTTNKRGGAFLRHMRHLQ